MFPTLTDLGDGWARLFWQAGTWTFEQSLPPESIACFKAAVVTLLMLFVCLVLRRWENFDDEPRRK